MALGSTSNPDKVTVQDLPGGGQAAADNTPRPGGPAQQPLDSDLTAIALLATTAYGRNLLTLANQAALAALLAGAVLNPAGLQLATGLQPSTIDQIGGFDLIIKISGSEVGRWSAGSVVLLLPASTSARAPLRLPHGAAPSAPVNGDMWTTTAGLFVRVNGVTVGPLS